MKILINDTVQVIAGKDKGKTGVVRRKNGERIVVEGINKHTKHLKGKEGKPGQKIQIEASLHASNVMLLDPKTKKPTRVKYEYTSAGEKRRIAVKSGEVIPSHIKKKK